jgi:hypothetical protein
MDWRTHSLQLAARGAATTGLVLVTSCGSQSASLSADGSGSADRSRSIPHLTARAEPGHCSGRIEAVSIDGDVRVPDGATCELVGTRVEGNVSIGHSARLYARGVAVDGDIEGEGALTVDVAESSSVGGNVQLDSGGTALVTDSRIDGDLSWEDQHGELLAQGNTVRGNLDLEDNTGGVTVSGNTIGGDLACENNAPTPHGGDNSVSGNEEDQCHDL